MSDTDAILQAVGKAMKQELTKLAQRLEHAEARAARLEERLNKSLDRLDETEKSLELIAPVLRYVDKDGRVRLIKAMGGSQ